MLPRRVWAIAGATSVVFCLGLVYMDMDIYM